MASKPTYDPKKEVDITRATKRGDYYTVQGVAEGKKAEVHIPAPSLEKMSRRDAEAYMRRGLLGTKRMEERGER